ncbi:WD40 repeat-like protein [Mycena floridula]|nr:WD40 repeat-like protein [Mycena floridula]
MAASSSRGVPSTKPTKSSTSSRKEKGKGKEQAKSVQKRRVADPGSSSTDSDWDWISLTEASPTKTPPIFTVDGSYFFSLAGSAVRIYSSATGQVVSTLTAPPIPGKQTSPSLLTSAILNPHNTFQLITGSLDGTLRIWDFLDAALLKTIDVGQPILHICAHDVHKDAVFAAVTRTKKSGSTKDDNAIVLRVSLNGSSSESLPIGKTRLPTGLSFSPSGAYLVVTAAHKAYVALASSFTSGFTKYVSPDRLTCLAFHPSEDYFATGDTKGNISLWYCLNDQTAVKTVGLEKKAQTSSFHWHAHAVSSISFTSNGAYLLSGGEEAVLVIWQLDTGKKEFVPRLGAPINTISLAKPTTNEEEYLLGLADATYIFISAATLKISRSFCRVKLDPSSTNSPSLKSAPLAYHALTATLILPSSHASSLQIYSPPSSKLISELEVSPSNRVSRRDEKPLEPAQIEQTVISVSGDWMATLDAREGDVSLRGEVYLKLWKWDRKAGYWELNTRVDRPHGLSKATHMAFSPDSAYLVTTGEDTLVKMWRIHSSKSKSAALSGSVPEFWVARSSSGFRSELPVHASWSQDSSLLAICLGPYVALYDPISNMLSRALTGPECKRPMCSQFVGRGCRFLAVAGQHDLVLWDLVSQSVRWHYESVPVIVTIIPHPQIDSFAMFHRLDNRETTQISIFHPSSSKPSSTSSIPFTLMNVAWYSPQLKTSSFSFVAITAKWTVIMFGDNVRTPEAPSASAISTSSAPQRKTLFQDVFGKSAFKVPSPPPATALALGISALPSSSTVFDSIFTSPYYSMPPLETLFEPLMGTFLKLQNEDTSVPEVQTEEMVVDMDVDASVTVSIPQRQRRHVDQKEMDAVVELFRAHSTKPPSSPVVSKKLPKTNGAMKNGKVNGHSETRTSTKGAVASKEPVVPPSPPSSPLPTSMNGKKRKKP